MITQGSTTRNHTHAGVGADGGSFDAANLGAGASTDGQVLMSDGAGGAAWESMAVGDLPIGVFPKRSTMWMGEAIQTVGTGASLAVDVAQLYQAVLYNNNADGDTFTHGCVLLAGTYTMYMLGLTDNNRGKLDWYIDNVKVVSLQDWYSAAGTKNVIKSASSISVATSGWHTIKVVVNGKNSSSSDYYLSLTNIWFVPAAD